MLFIELDIKHVSLRKEWYQSSNICLFARRFNVLFSTELWYKKIVCRMSEPPRFLACLNYFIFIFSIRHRCMFWSWRHVYIMDIMTVAYTHRVFATRRSKMFFYFLFIHFSFLQTSLLLTKTHPCFSWLCELSLSLICYLLLWFFFFFIFILGMSCNGYSFK